MQGPVHKTSRLRYFGYALRRILRRMFTTYGTPHSIALGGSIGIFVSFTPTVGIQTLLAVPAALLLKANPVTAYFPIWITNPLTIPPIYYFNTYIGALILGTTDELSWEFFKSINIDNALSKIGDILWPMVLGSCIVGLILALLCYPIFYRIAAKIKERRQKQEVKWREIIASASIKDKFPESARRTPTSARLKARNGKSDKEPGGKNATAH